MKPFQTRTYGKWILAGEHAVLRQSPALAFPLMEKSLDLSYEPGAMPLDVEFTGEHGTELKLLFYGVLENALSRLKVSESLGGRFKVRSALPVGAGMGASAALCGAVARWCEAQTWIPEGEVYEFACRLEDLFHGESSGVDVAVSLSAQGVRFRRGGERIAVQPEWWPRLYLSYSGRRGMTSECVAKVKQLFETDHPLAVELDQRMQKAVELATRAFQSSKAQGFGLLIEALKLGRDCFERWGLCQGDLNSHMKLLDAAGALAVKPTGSGGGGYVLSLWDSEPPDELLSVLMSVPQPNL